MSPVRSSALPLVGGFHVGPLFVVVIRQSAREDNRGPARVRKVRSRIPAWADLDAIKSIYRQAHDATDATGVQHSVDHIVPIESPIVCGLHVEHNLRVAPLVQNMRKSNKHWPDMPFEQLDLL